MKTIVIFRHAEKPDDDKDPHLSRAGRERAHKIAKLVEDKYGEPDYIFAAKNSKESHRPVETAEPLAGRYGLKIHTPYKDRNYKQLAYRLNLGHMDETIVVFWHHGCILDLAKELGSDIVKEARWPEDLFDQYIELKFPSTAVLAQLF